MEKSLWQKDNYDKNLNKIDSNLNTDILIIGAGITGITLAYNLIDSKYIVTLIDRNKFFNEASSKNTGKLNYLQDLKYSNIEKIYGFDVAKKYYESQKEAIEIVKKNIEKNKIDCDIIKTKSSVFIKDNKKIIDIKKEKEFFNKINVSYSENISILEGNNIKDIITVNDSYVFNPVKYLNGLYEVLKKSSNIKMYENSLAFDIKKVDNYYEVNVNDYIIKTKILVMTCNYPFFTLPFLVPLKTYNEKSYLSAYKIDNKKNIDAILADDNVISYRYTKDNYFIYLNNSSKLCDKLNYEKNYNENLFEGGKIANNNYSYKWTNMDVMTNDNLPYIGKIDDSFYIATGYNTWGMTNGTIAAKVVKDLIIDNESNYEELFSLKRKINLEKIKNFTINTLLPNIKAYSFSLIKKNPSWYKNKAIITNIKGKRVGIYYDSENNNHIVSNICPHLKCFLTFNSVDKTWDCPCHGSRFDIDGNCTKGPSSYNIKIDDSK